MSQPVEMVVASTRGADAPDRGELAHLLAQVQRRGMPLTLNDDPLVAPGGYLDGGRLEQADDGAWELHLSGHMIEEVLLLEDAPSVMARRGQVRRQLRTLLNAAESPSPTIILQYDEVHYRRENLARLEQPAAGPAMTLRPFRRRSRRSLPVLEVGIPLAVVASGWFGGVPGEEPDPDDPHFRQQLVAGALSCQDPRGAAEPPPPTLVFSLALEERAVQGVSRAQDAAVLTAAARSVGELLVQGLSWQEALSRTDAGRMLFRFSGERRRWQLHYVLFAGGELLLSEAADGLRQEAVRRLQRGGSHPRA